MSAWIQISKAGIFLAAVLVSGSAWAQDDEDAASSEDGASDGAAADEESEDAAADDAAADDAAEDDAAADDAAEDDTPDEPGSARDESPVELPGETYRFVGLRTRLGVIPKGILKMFAEGGRTVVSPGIGPEFGIRKDNMEYSLSIWYANYGFDPVLFKAKGDPDVDYEFIESEIKTMWFTSDFLWTIPVTPEFGWNIGFGAGLGVVFGRLYRSQAYPGSGNPADLDGYLECRGAGDSPFCANNDNDHYAGYYERSWTNGGSKPNIFPWLAFQTGPRFKPVRSFAARIDMGFALTGLFFGLSADYGI